MIRILFFGPVAEQVGKRQLELEYNAGMRLQEVIDQLRIRYEKANSLVSFIAVNSVQTRDMDMVLSDQDEIALMSKFSGG